MVGLSGAVHEQAGGRIELDLVWSEEVCFGQHRQRTQPVDALR